MKIIIVGNGKVGYAIAKQLSGESHDITMVDRSAEALSRAENTLDIMGVVGNAASISVLVGAGARNADLVIAVTNLDETNLVCCLIAKKLGAKHTVARVRNPEYRSEANLLKQEIGLDMVINPDLAAALEISRILAFPAAFSVEPFARGRIDMIGFAVKEEDKLCGMALHELSRQHHAQVLFGCVQRGEEFIIPDGSYVPQSGDNVYMLGTKPELQKMLHAIGRQWQAVRSASILGGSRIAQYLCQELKKAGISVRLVEQDEQKCLTLAEALPHVMVIQGDGTDSDLLQQENIYGTDAFISLTGRDEENLLMAMHAQRSGVDKVIAKMTRPNYMDMVKEMGVASVISPKDIVASQITRYVRALANSNGSAVESLYKLLGGAVEAAEFVASDASEAVLHTPLKDMKLKKGVLVAAIARHDAIIIPGGMTTIEPEDTVVVIARERVLHDLTDILA